MRIIFKTTSSNKYSINTLTKAIEEFDLDIYFENELNKIISLCDRSSVVVFSFMDMNSKKEIEDAIKIKKLKPQTKIIGGGAFFSNKTNIFPFDHIFISEGELSIREFLKGNIYEYKYIPKNFISLDEFGSISQKYKRFGSIEITRGCSYGCKYCQTPIIFGRKMRHKSIDKIIEEVEILLKNNFTDIRFITPDLASYGTNQKH
ncbi:MAG: radical SAM protein, partial [Elusimicrobiales bacterium]|nr:radical SAM protein [Elusimicrobiales bacterium]